MYIRNSLQLKNINKTSFFVARGGVFILYLYFMKKSECNHGTLKKCAEMRVKNVEFPSVDSPYKLVEFYRCKKCNKKFNLK